MNSTGAHLGSGVDVQGFRRIRDQFLDLQYRGQNTSLNDWKAQTEALDTAELALAEPGDTGINAQLANFWNAWSDLSKSPDSTAAKQALVQKAGALTDTIHSVRSQMVAAQETAQGQYDAIAGPGGDVEKIATELADLNRTISSFLTNGDSPNDLMDRRDLLLDQLSGYGQISVEQLDGGSLNVSFVDASNGSTYPIVSDQTADWAGPPAGGWNPGGADGRPADRRQDAGRHDRRLPRLDRLVLEDLADTVNAAYGGTFLSYGSPGEGASIQVAAAIQAAPASVRSGSGASGSNDIAQAISQLRGNAAVDGAYKAFVAKVGGDLNNATRMQGNAQVLADSVENRRQSVQGVSMDEEMSNLVRFQRAYQASARAMSTMDEMLDVLINRTGRVGL